MKTVFLCFCLAFALDLATTERVVAQDGASQVAAAQAQAAVPQVSPTVSPSPAPAVVAVPEPAAPPTWASDLLVTASKLPVVGPILSKAMLYVGILAMVLTTLVAAALSILTSLQSAFKLAGLANAEAVIIAFKNSKVMYWLTYFSNFNAKKPVA